MRAVITSPAIPMEYFIEPKKEDWCENLLVAAEWIASRFSCDSKLCFMECDPLYCDVLVWDNKGEAGKNPETHFIVLRGTVAQSLKQHCHIDRYVESDEWLCNVSPNCQIAVFTNVMRGETLAFVC